MGKVQTQDKVSKGENIYGLFCFFLELAKLAKLRYNFSNNGQSSNPRQSSDITLLIMGKFQTKGKVGKVGDNFGLIWHLVRQGKVGKVEI